MVVCCIDQFLPWHNSVRTVFGVIVIYGLDANWSHFSPAIKSARDMLSELHIRRNLEWFPTTKFLTRMFIISNLNFLYNNSNFLHSIGIQFLSDIRMKRLVYSNDSQMVLSILKIYWRMVTAHFEIICYYAETYWLDMKTSEHSPFDPFNIFSISISFVQRVVSLCANKVKSSWEKFRKPSDFSNNCYQQQNKKPYNNIWDGDRTTTWQCCG